MKWYIAGYHQYIYVSEPTTKQYTDIAKDFESIWNISKYVGAIDGKHVRIKCPANSGLMYHNYKKYFSLLLMGICDDYGSQSEGICTHAVC